MTKREIFKRLIEIRDYANLARGVGLALQTLDDMVAQIAADIEHLLLDLAAPKEEPKAEEKPEADQGAAGAWFKCCPLRNKGLNPACDECEPTLCKYCAQSPLLLFEDGAPTRPCPYCNDGEMVKLKTPLKMKKGYSVWLCKTCHEPFVEADPRREEDKK